MFMNHDTRTSLTASISFVFSERQLVDLLKVPDFCVLKKLFSRECDNRAGSFNLISKFSFERLIIAVIIAVTKYL